MAKAFSSQPLVNEFTWSISRSKLFEQCRRRYFYCYYGSWGGWDFQSPARARLLYRLKKIMTLNMWAGKVVHRTIETALGRLRQHRPMDLEALQNLSRRMLNEEWRESETKQWMRHPNKYVNLFEHYYQRETGGERRAELRQRVFDSLQGWLDLEFPQRFAALKTEDWLMVEELKSFPVDGTKVWLVVDCANRAGEGISIFDWKTGEPSEDEEACDQLVCYALYCMQAYQVPLEKIEVSLVHLPHKKMSTFRVSPEQLIDFRERLYQSAQAMRDCLADPGGNVAREEDFPQIEEARSCSWCEFAEACGRATVANA